MSVFERQYLHSSHYTARMLRTVMRLIGMKKNTEQNMVHNRFKKVPDALPVKFKRSCAIKTEKFAGQTVWIIQSKTALRASEDNHAVPVLLYFHGGAFLEGITKRHWLLINELVQACNGTIVFPDYPLASEHGYHAIQDFALALYQSVSERFSASRVILLGDSAGGGLALSIALQLRNQGAQLPQALVLYSPWLDLTMNNPQLAELEKFDEILSVQGLKAAAVYYAQGTLLDDWRISPIYGSFHNLCPIALFTGTHDLLYADAVRFKEHLVAAERDAQPRAEPINGERGAQPRAEPIDQKSAPLAVWQTYPDLYYYEYPGMFHDWMLVPSLLEAQDVIAKTIAFCNEIVS